MNNYFLEKNGQFTECKIITETPHKRTIQFLEGVYKNKNKIIHPVGVAWGKRYPRLFESTSKPTGFFEFKGRVLLKHPKVKDLVPATDAGYRFQKYTVNVIDSIHQKENVLLVGGTGTGKTSCIVQLASRINQTVLRVNFNGETRMSDFLGKMQVLDGQTVWTDGILPLAMRHGHWLILDEIDFADPSVLSLLHPVLEDDPCLVLKENNGEVIKPHPDFRIFGTANSIGAMQDRSGAYTGTNQMNDAFLDRWNVILVPNLSPKEELRVLKNKVGGLKNKWAKGIIDFAQKARSAQLGDYSFTGDNFSTRRVLNWGKKTALWRSPIEGAKLAWMDKVSESDHPILMKILETFFGRREKKVKEKAVKDPTAPKRKRGRPRKNP